MRKFTLHFLFIIASIFVSFSGFAQDNDQEQIDSIAACKISWESRCAELDMNQCHSDFSCQWNNFEKKCSINEDMPKCRMHRNPPEYLDTICLTVVAASMILGLVELFPTDRPHIFIPPQSDYERHVERERQIFVNSFFQGAPAA